MIRILFAMTLAIVGLKTSAETLTLKSPDGRLSLGFSADEKGLSWSLEGAAKPGTRGQALVQPSKLGLTFAGLPQYGTLKIVGKEERAADATWKNPLYRRETIRDNFRELTVHLEESAVAKGCQTSRRMDLVFRAYNEGVAFRYVIPAQPEIPGFQILGEQTEWRFSGDPEAWVTTYKSHLSSQESPFSQMKLGAVPPEAFVGMPVLVKTGGRMLALTEAALSNWAGLFFKNGGQTPQDGGQTPQETCLKAFLSPLPPSSASAKDVAVICETPAASPWRVVMVGMNELDLLNKNDIIQNLNPPPEEGLDFSWVKPGATSWDWWVESNNSLSTELTCKLVDFAAEMGWPYHTIDGGWYGFARRPNHGPNVKIEPRPGFDLKGIVEHAKAKGVGIWVWLHWQALEDNGVEATFAKLENWGVKGVKIDFHDRQDQWMVCWFEKVCRLAARHRILVNFHGAFKPTGTERTWPNNLTREGILGNEMTKFSDRITPAHCATLPFTRFLLGPGDFTPGSFANVYAKDFTPQSKKGHRYGDESDRRPIWAETIGTRACAIAQCIAFDGGLVTLCDWPERYRGADGIEALRSLPTAWKSTRPVSGVCGGHYAVVREAYDGRFYFAAFTAKRKLIDLKLDFLGEGEWKMRVFADDPELTPGDAKAIALAERKVKPGQVTAFELLDEGGAVAIFERMK